MTIEYKNYSAYKNAPDRIKKQFDNFFIKLKALRVAYIKTQNKTDLQKLQNFYNKMHNSIIYKSAKYSTVYCQILSDII